MNIKIRNTCLTHILICLTLLMSKNSFSQDRGIQNSQTENLDKLCSTLKNACEVASCGAANAAEIAVIKDFVDIWKADANQLNEKIITLQKDIAQTSHELSIEKAKLEAITKSSPLKMVFGNQTQQIQAYTKELNQKIFELSLKLEAQKGELGSESESKLKASILQSKALLEKLSIEIDYYNNFNSKKSKVELVETGFERIQKSELVQKLLNHPELPGFLGKKLIIKFEIPQSRLITIENSMGFVRISFKGFSNGELQKLHYKNNPDIQAAYMDQSNPSNGNWAYNLVFDKIIGSSARSKWQTLINFLERASS